MSLRASVAFILVSAPAAILTGTILYPKIGLWAFILPAAVGITFGWAVRRRPA